MGFKFKLSFFVFALAVAGCSSAPKSTSVNLDNIGKEEVIQKFGKDELLKSAEPFVVQGGVVIATSFVTIPSDHRPEAGIKMAQVRGVGTLATTVERRIETALQVSSESTSADAVQMRELIAESSKITANEFKPGRVYYEKVKVI